MNNQQTLSGSFTAKENRVIALAALFQAAQAVNDLANSGVAEAPSEQCLIASLFVFDSNSTLEIYGNDLRNLQSGLTLLSKLAEMQNKQEFKSIAKYALSLLSLNNQLSKQGDMLNVIHSRLKHAGFNQQHFSDDNLRVTTRSLSGIYQDTISTLRFRIHVTGNMQLLTQEAISDRVRAMLFAGIRAAMLWQQLGGSKWQLIFKRSEIEKISQKLLQQSFQSSIH
jgi:high frequency lysogenization protein